MDSYKICPKCMTKINEWITIYKRQPTKMWILRCQNEDFNCYEKFCTWLIEYLKKEEINRKEKV